MFPLEAPEQHDTLPGVSAPALTPQLFGHQPQAKFLADSYKSGRLHHALLFEGPNGIGKATLALHLAQHLLLNPTALQAPSILQLMDQDSPDFRQFVGGAHSQVLHLTRPFDPKTEKFKTVLTVEEIRRIGHFLSRTNAGAGYRTIIIDAADDMNAAAANALLKNLEEPPVRTLFILINHGSGSLLPTIRSRCQAITFQPLDDTSLKRAFGASITGSVPDEEVIALSEGSVRRALTMAVFGGLEVVRSAEFLVSSTKFDSEKAAKLGDAMTGRDSDIQYQLLIDYLLSKVATAAMRQAHAGELIRARRLSETHMVMACDLKAALTYNLDRKQTIFGLIAALQGKFSNGLL